MLTLNKDVLILILEELKDDSESLFSCLSVNRLWCEIVIPILWSYPWKHIRSKNFGGGLERKKSLLNTILLHLPETSRKLLMNGGINIFSAGRQKQQLLFDYVSFCKYIIHEFIFDYETYNSFNLNTPQKILLEREVYKLFVGKCSAIKYLNLNEIIHPIYQFLGANTCLRRLYELNCETSKESSFFYGLAQICKSIEKILIYLWNDNPGLGELIKIQKQIKYLKIFAEDFRSEDKGMNEYKRVAQALEKQALSIYYLELWMAKCFPFFLFPKLINLQTLILVNDLYVNQQVFEKYLIASVYPKLQILELDEISLYIATNIIQNTGGKLWKIQIQGGINFNYLREYIQSIYKYCPDIKYVSIFLNNQNLDEFEKLLINCHHLEGVDIQIEADASEKFYGDKFLELFVKLAPISIYKIQVDLNEFTVESLDLFLHNWRGRKPLCLYLLAFEQVPGSVLALLEKYKVEEGIVKNYSDHRNFWNIDNQTKVTWIY